MITMNKVEYLLRALDIQFGYIDKIKSSFKKRSEAFDQHRNEHVILIEYRVSRKKQMPVVPMKTHRNPEVPHHENTNVNRRSLLEFIIDRCSN